MIEGLPEPWTEDFGEWLKNLPKPPGWDTVWEDDDCECPKGGTHRKGCIYG